jgi:hypothetical protein
MGQKEKYDPAIHKDPERPNYKTVLIKKKHSLTNVGSISKREPYFQLLNSFFVLPARL